MEATTGDILRVYWQHVRRYKWTSLFILIFFIFGEILEIVVPTYYKQFFDVLSLSAPSLATTTTLVNILWIVFSIHLLSWLLHRIASLVSAWLQPRVMADLEQTSFTHLIRHSYGFFSNAFAGALVRKVGRLPRGFESLADTIEYRALPVLISVIGVMYILWGRNPLLAWIMLAWTFLFILVNYLIARWKLRYDILRAQRDTELTAVLSDSITNSITVKLFSGFDHENKLFRGASEALRKMRVFTWSFGTINDALQHLLMIVIEVLIMFMAVRYWSQGLITLGDFALIQGLLLTLFNKLWDFGKVIRDVYEGFADAKEMVEILKMPHGIKDARGAKPIEVTRGKIEFKNVDFTYNKTRGVLRQFNALIRPHEKIALVGPSGAGKSTITKLLLRFHDIDKGTILIDGQNIAKITQDSLRDAIALVPQEPILFHRSLMENIRYGRSGATDEEVIEAAHKAHCHEFIIDMPNGYDTFVGERGVKLSGGERQRVAIARAILKNAPVLILDEATSSLDSESEALIQEALHELMKGKTTIVIAHRLSTIMQMDRILVVENGQVTNTGTHLALIKKRGTYRKLWQIQAGGFLP